MKLKSKSPYSRFLAVGLALTGSLSAQVTTLVDSLLPFPPLTVDASIGLEHSIGQQFFTDHRGAISSVTLAAYRVGRPTGSFHLEIWDDGGGIPGKRVATLGSQDAAEVVAFADFGEQRWQEITFDKAVTGLHPKSSYYLVINVEEMIQDLSNFLSFSRPHGSRSGFRLDSELRTGSWVSEEFSFFSGFADKVGVRISIREDDLPAGDPRIAMIYDTLSSTENPARACPTDPSELGAQPFRVGPHGVVSSATIMLANSGNPTGVGRLEIWTEENGKPGHPVGTLGEVDFATITGFLYFDSPIWETRTLNNPVTGLEPGAIYFVVGNVRDVTTNAGYPCSATVGAEASDELLVLTSPDTWTPVSSVLGSGRPRYRMTLTADPADVPSPKISSITYSETSVNLTWESVPFRSYTIEANETLDEESWTAVVTNISAEGNTTSHEYVHPSSLPAKRRFFRVRMEE